MYNKQVNYDSLMQATVHIVHRHTNANNVRILKLQANF